MALLVSILFLFYSNAVATLIAFNEQYIFITIQVELALKYTHTYLFKHIKIRLLH